MGTKSTTHAGFYQITRLDRILQERIHDTYKISSKLPEPTICPHCSAVFQQGRWQWLEKPLNAHQHTCPACQRTLDHYPAGFLTLKGDFFFAHRDEIINLIHNIEQREKAEHPLKRIMAIEEKDNEDNAVLVTTTDLRLTSGFGEAIHDAYQGHLEIHYNPDENLVRVGWSR